MSSSAGEYDRIQRNAVAAARRRLSRQRAGCEKDAEELHSMAVRLRAIISRHQRRPGASVTGLESAARELEYSSRVMRS